MCVLTHRGGPSLSPRQNCDELDSRGLEALGVTERTLGQRRTIVMGDVHTVAGESQAEAGELGGGVALVGDALLWLQVRARPDLA